MPLLTHVRWTLTPEHPPEPWLNCAGCGTERRFRPAMKARLNANGKRLDAWAIYRCAECDRTWNRPLFERRLVADIDAATLAALQSNDAAWLARDARDVEGLRRHTHRIALSEDLRIAMSLIGRVPSPEEALRIDLVPDGPIAQRLDRLLASGLGLSRADIVSLVRAGRLALDQPGTKMLRRPPRQVVRATIRLAGIERARAIISVATGEA